MDDVVKVRALTELRAGLAVFELGCVECSKDHWMSLLGPDEDPNSTCRDHERTKACPEGASWRIVGCRGERACLAACVREGRLWRLREETPRDLMRNRRAALERTYGWS